MAHRLAHEASAYLRQHAQNPVDWYPWGPEAHRAARELDRPVLLSVGYSACHWCHVMAHESFEDPETARAMNEGFVCIKVDREERPDVDRLYQGVVRLMGRGGGWPLTVFLSPDLRPFFGGTYFPDEDRHGLPAFRKVLAAVLEGWRSRRGELTGTADDFEQGLRALMGAGLGARSGELSRRDLVFAGTRLAEEIDRVHGGFGGGPKFPNPALLDLVLRAWRRTGDARLLADCRLTLDAMAGRGLFDHLGGGFHRYCVDEAWAVPHFEKMLYDNGQLLRLFAAAHQIRPDPEHARAVELTVGWLAREMASPEGAFYSSQDADSPEGEGRFFVWTPREVEAVGGTELGRLLCRRYGVTARGNFEGGASVLSLAEPVAALAAEVGREEAAVAAEVDRGRALLLGARARRAPPGRDEKIVAGWNGLAIGGLARAARAFARPEWAGLARRCADFVLSAMWRDGRLARVFADGRARTDGQLEDYGDLAEGLVQLAMATYEARYLLAARALCDRAAELFWDEDARAFLAAPRDGERLVVPVWAVEDDAWPSGASTLCEAEIALAALTGDAARLDRPREYLEHLREPMISNPFSFGRLWCAADALLDGAAALAVVGDRESAGPLLAAIDRRYAPTLAVAWAPSAEAAAEPLVHAFEGKRAADGGAAAFLCRSFSCEPPVRSAEELQGLQI